MRFPLSLTFSIVAGATAQLLMKSGLQNMDSIIPSFPVVAGVGCYGLAMITWTIALKRYQLSFAYPLLSLGYLLVYFGACFWPGLEEQLTWNKSAGICLIILGVTISSQFTSNHNNNNARVAHE